MFSSNNVYINTVSVIRLFVYDVGFVAACMSIEMEIDGRLGLCNTNLARQCCCTTWPSPTASFNLHIHFLAAEATDGVTFAESFASAAGLAARRGRLGERGV